MNSAQVDLEAPSLVQKNTLKRGPTRRHGATYGFKGCHGNHETPVVAVQVSENCIGRKFLEYDRCCEPMQPVTCLEEFCILQSVLPDSIGSQIVVFMKSGNKGTLLDQMVCDGAALR